MDDERIVAELRDLRRQAREAYTLANLRAMRTVGMRTVLCGLQACCRELLAAVAVTASVVGDD